MKPVFAECGCADLNMHEEAVIYKTDKEQEAHEWFHVLREKSIRRDIPMYWSLHLKGKHVLCWTECPACDRLFFVERN